jgi:hypothetical protein
MGEDDMLLPLDVFFHDDQHQGFGDVVQLQIHQVLRLRAPHHQ